MNQNQNQNHQSQTQSTRKGRQSPTPSTSEDMPQENATQQEAAPAPPLGDALLKHLSSILEPLLEFHKAVEHASENDLRLYWDIRLVQGKDTPFTSMSGHSSFPGVLVGSALGQIPASMSREIVEKIAVPLAARLQDMTNDRAISVVMKNVTTITPPKADKNVLLAATSESQNLIPDAERTELLDVMLPKDIVKDAENIIAELKKNE
jgi:hypothetical protein